MTTVRSTPERVQLAFRRVDAALRSWTWDAVIAEDLDVLRKATHSCWCDSPEGMEFHDPEAPHIDHETGEAL